MKKLSFLFLFLSVVGFAQSIKNTPVFKFEKTTIDYGTVKKASDGNRVFIMPGEKGEIKVHYNTNLVGSFQKNIRITSNASLEAVVVHIKGIVTN